MGEAQISQLSRELDKADGLVHRLEHYVGSLDVSMDNVHVMQVREAAQDIDERVCDGRPLYGSRLVPKAVGVADVGGKGLEVAVLHKDDHHDRLWPH